MTYLFDLAKKAVMLAFAAIVPAVLWLELVEAIRFNFP